MAANYELPNVVEKRVRFFDGQFLQDQDFIDEQKYHLDREHRHNRQLHGAGIVEGLTVTAIGPNLVTVAAGTAIDSDGRQLVLAEAHDQAIDAEDDSTGNHLYLVYQELATDQQAGTGSADDTRWQELPQVVLIPQGQDYEGDMPPVLLAELALDNRGNVDVNTGDCEYAGVRMPGPTADASTLRTAPNNRVMLTGALSVTETVGIGTSTLSPDSRLQVNGTIEIKVDDADSKLRFHDPGNAQYSMGIDQSDKGKFKLNAGPELGEAAQLVMSSSGNIGIGTEDVDNNRLHVHDGSTLLGGDLTVQNTLSVSGHVGIGTNASDSLLALKGENGYDIGITQKQVGGEATMELTTADSEGTQATRLLLRGANNDANIEFYRGKSGQEKLNLMIDGMTGDVEVKGTLTAGKLVGEGAFSRGMILMWSGSVSNLPKGWKLCNGEDNGTPDLRGQFIVGYDNRDSDYDQPGKHGGEKRHTLTINEMPKHNHSHTAYRANFNHAGEATEGSTKDDGDGRFTVSGHHTGGSQPHENRPPYYVLAYIMKL